MALTRAQLIAGNSSEGIVLEGQVQGVTAGTGISIATNGEISVDSATIAGLMKLNNAQAYNSYVWPTSVGTAGQLLTIGLNGSLEWSGGNYVAQTTPTSGTPSAVIPVGPTSGRQISPAPASGYLRYNSTIQSLELFEGTTWVPVPDFNDVTLTGTTTILGPTNSNNNIEAASYSVNTNPGIDLLFVTTDRVGGGLSLTFEKGLLIDGYSKSVYSIDINTTADGNLANRVFTLGSFGTVLYNVEWGDNTYDTGVTDNYITHTYASPGSYTIKVETQPPDVYRVYNLDIGNIPTASAELIIGVNGSSIDFSFGPDLGNAWRNCTNMVRVADLDLRSTTVLVGAFENCTSLASFPVLAVGNCDNFQNTWRGCTSLKSFPVLDFSLGQLFDEAWNGCSSLLSLSVQDFPSGTSFGQAWKDCTGLTTFPLSTFEGLGINFTGAWFGCSGFTSFPALNLDTANLFVNAWGFCTGLTTFPIISCSGATDYSGAWNGCSGLTSFPSLTTTSATNLFAAWQDCTNLATIGTLSTANVADFGYAWNNNPSLGSVPVMDFNNGQDFTQSWAACSSLTTFPTVTFDSGVDFLNAWGGCTSLSSFPANAFDNTPGTNFDGAFGNCALTQTSIRNILTSLVTAGQTNGLLDIGGGTSSGFSSWAAATKTQYNTLVSRGWTIIYNP